MNYARKKGVNPHPSDNGGAVSLPKDDAWNLKS